MISNFLNPEGHQNPFSGSTVLAILLKGCISPIGGASAGEGLPCSLRSRFFYLVGCPVHVKYKFIMPCPGSAGQGRAALPAFYVGMS
jgi:hypothetical protein